MSIGSTYVPDTEAVDINGDISQDSSVQIQALFPTFTALVNFSIVVNGATLSFTAGDSFPYTDAVAQTLAAGGGLGTLYSQP